MNFTSGRSNRKEYWISVSLLLAAAVAAAAFDLPGSLNTPLTIVWILVWRRRQHDLNLSGWIVAIPIVLLLVLVAGAFFIGGAQFGDSMVAANRNEAHPTTEFGDMVYAIVILVGLLIQLAFTVWLGIRAGDPHENRFGPVPGAPAPASQAATFE